MSESSEYSVGNIILLFGIIAGLGDVVYEGGRSIIPTYLESLNFNAFAVGAILGLAELIGYILRIVIGYLSDRNKLYWPFIIAGYSLLIVVPILGLTSAIAVIIIVIIMERVAKGVRSPAKSTVFSVLTKELGTGKAFGLYEFFDQFGAVLGPAIVAYILYTTKRFRSSFLILIIPYLVMVGFLIYLYQSTHTIAEQKIKELHQETMTEVSELSKSYWFYTGSVLFSTIGLFPVTLILYLGSSVFAFYQVALLYLIVQAIDGISAIVFGHIYDLSPRIVFPVVMICSIFPTIFISSIPLHNLTIAAIIFGIVLGAQESIMKAKISDITPVSKRSLGYGVFQTIFGLGLFLSGSIFGLFIDLNLSAVWLILLTVLCQMIAILLFVKSVEH